MSSFVFLALLGLPFWLFLIFNYLKFGGLGDLIFSFLFSALITASFYSLIGLLVKKKFIKKNSAKIFLFLFLLIVSIWMLILFSGVVLWGRVPDIGLLESYAKQFTWILGIYFSNWFYVVMFSVGVIFLYLILFFYFNLIFNLSQWEVFFERWVLYSLASVVVFCFIFSSLFERSSLIEFFSRKYDDGNKWILLNSIGKNRSDESVFGDYVPLVLNGSDKKSVVVIVADALRPDRMGVYGAERNNTPFLSAQVASGSALAIEEARASCSESTCGLLSLLSGKDPASLAVKNFGLNEIFKAHGYVTHYYLSGDHSNYYGLKESYGTPDYYRDGVSKGASDLRGSGYVNDDLSLVKYIDNLPDASSDRNFIFIHMMSVHGLGYLHDEYKIWNPSESIYSAGVALERYKSGEGVFLDEKYYNSYDNSILQFDDYLAKIIQSLREKSYINEKSLILITSDHGESLGEHGILTHANNLYESVIRIPWIFMGDFSGLERDWYVQADFAGLVLEKIGLNVPVEMKGGAFFKNGVYYTFHAQYPYYSVIEYERGARYKFIVNKISGEIFYYDLLMDPDEISSLALDEGKSNFYIKLMYERGIIALN